MARQAGSAGQRRLAGLEEEGMRGWPEGGMGRLSHRVEGPFHLGSFSPTPQRDSCVCSSGHPTVLKGTKNHNGKGPITPLPPQQAQHPTR